MAQSSTVHAPASGYRKRLRLDPSTFTSDLASFGRAVPPRGRNQQAKEEFCLRRLLIALHRTKRVGSSLTVWSADNGSGQSAPGPDFILNQEDGTCVGVEVTSAGSASWNKWNAAVDRTNEEATLFPAKDGYVGSEPDRQTIKDVICAIDRKITQYPRYDSVLSKTELLVYENSEGGLFADPENICRGVRAYLALIDAKFSAVHLIIQNRVYLDLKGSRFSLVDLETDYDTNLDGWLRNQAAALREGRYGDLDPENVAEELEGLARSDRRALKSHLAILIEHLLKWELQKDRRSNSWKSSIANARDAVSELLEETPSLERELEDAATKAFSRARRTVAAETGIKIELLPSQLPYAVDQLLDEKFLPLGENDG